MFKKRIKFLIASLKIIRTSAFLFLSLIFYFCGSFAASAEPKAKEVAMTPQVINQILFYESNQSWTSRDFELFQKLKKIQFQKNNLSQFTDTANEEYLLSRLAAREALLFEVTPARFILNEKLRKSLSEYSNREIDEELKQIGLSVNLIELKETQLKTKLRFKTWFDLLKRKYQVKIKSADFS